MATNTLSDMDFFDKQRRTVVVNSIKVLEEYSKSSELAYNNLILSYLINLIILTPPRPCNGIGVIMQVQYSKVLL